jgi:cell division protein FtsB
MSTPRVILRNALFWLLFGGSLLTLVRLFGSLVGFYSASERVVIAEAELQALQTQQEVLVQEYEVKRSDEYREQLIRDTLKMSRPGETVIILPEVSPSPDNLESMPMTGGRSDLQPWQLWWGLFFN